MYEVCADNSIYTEPSPEYEDATWTKHIACLAEGQRRI